MIKIKGDRGYDRPTAYCLLTMERFGPIGVLILLVELDGIEPTTS